MPLAQIDQTIPMYFNTQQILKNTAEVLQIPVSNLRSQEEVQAMIQAQQREKEAQQQMQLAESTANVTEKQAKANALNAQAEQ